MKYLIIFFLVFSFVLFFYINNSNYTKIKEVKYQIVHHPEMLPKKEIAKYTSLWFSNLRADIYWLEAIQYIWWNAIWAEYKKYLFQMIDLITELNPYFEKPYLIWQILLPDYNQRYENIDKKEIDKNQKNAETLWLKWIKNFCDENKINLILEENDLNKIWTEEKYKDPCKSFDLPFNQWFLEYFYLKDSLKASNYYKISSANSNSLDWAKIMTAIMTWKSWNRETSIFMFLTLADNYAWKDRECKLFSDELKNYSYSIFRLWNKLTSKDLKNINNLREKYFKFNEEKEKELLLNDGNCINYVNKATRELNLAYLEDADKIFFEKTWKNSKDAKELFDKKYIDYLPIDFQQYKNQGVIYFYNNEIKQYDYKMGVN